LSERASDKSRHIPVDVSEARLARLWGNVSERLEQPARSRRFPLVAAGVGAVALSLALGVGVVRHRNTSVGATASVWEGARLETAADRMSVSLVDGSKLTLDPNSRVTVQDRSPSAVKLVVERGRLACDVTHRPGRSFVVVASGVEVRVVGTRFSVSSERVNDAVRVGVQVERGVVEVRTGGESGAVTRVSAGQSWSQHTTARSAISEPHAQGVAPAGSASADESESAPREATSISPSATPTVSSRALPAATPASSSARNARELFEQATGLWREGRAQEAAQAYQTLLSTYPRDARAGLAAFELGRLRMDRLGDLPGALRALERAVTLAPSAGFREDALARVVRASAALGNARRCASAREQYLRDYPQGVHRLNVANSCAGR
jgi:transmembrane sensor